MKRLMALGLFGLVGATLLIRATGAELPYRSWTALNGSKVEAQFVRQRGETVVLNQKTGSPLSIRLADLSTNDQQYVRELVASQLASTQEKRAAFLGRKDIEKNTGEAPSGKPDYLDEKEWEVILETSLARQNPKAYAGYLRQYRQSHLGGLEFSTSRGVLITSEGVQAVDEAIAFLEKQPALGKLSPSWGLTRAARDHADDIGKSGQVGHTGSDRSRSVERVERYGQWDALTGENIQFGHGSARDIVMQLIVDDGVPDRGHRKNIFNETFKVAGLAIRPHKQYGSCCVIEYASGFSD